MKLLAFTRYDSMGASSRLRFYQFIPYLESAGISVEVQPLLSDVYLQGLYACGKRSLLTLAGGYLKRIRSIVDINQYDIIWLQKELFPWVPAIEEWLLARISRPFIVDYDDAVFHLYDRHKKRFIRNQLGNKIDSIMRSAKVVTVGNDYLAQRAERAGARCIEIIPTVVDTLRYTVGPRKEKLFTVGWIGTPITEKYLECARSALKILANEGDFRIVLVGASNDALRGLSPEIVEWTEDSEVASIHSFDVGIMPLLDNPFERGKCGYKLIQYMACGVPVIASPVGVNQKIVNHGKNGFLAATESEWVHHLRALKQDRELRIKMGENARATVEAKYSLSRVATAFCDMLLKLKNDQPSC